jgi:hypothetical protein
VTTFQMIALGVLGLSLLATYGQTLASKLPARKPRNQTMAHIDAIVRVRDAYTDPALTAACNALLAALLKVNP